MTPPRLLDLFSGAQGAGVGYARAGFEVHAIDIEPHPKHPEIASFTQADAMDVLADVEFLRTFRMIHASPPCQAYSAARVLNKDAAGYPELITPVIAALKGSWRPWVVENVEGSPLRGELMLCGSMFGLRVDCRDGVTRQLRRHRLFASDMFLIPPGHCRHHVPAISVFGNGGGSPGRGRAAYQGPVAESRAVMGIDWMRREHLSQAIPPAFTQWIGEQLLDALAREDLPHPVTRQPADRRDLLLGDAVRGEHPHRLMQGGPGTAVVPQGPAGGVGRHDDSAPLRDHGDAQVEALPPAVRGDRNRVSVLEPVDNALQVALVPGGEDDLGADEALPVPSALHGDAAGAEGESPCLRHADKSALLVGSLSTTSRQVAS